MFVEKNDERNIWWYICCVIFVGYGDVGDVECDWVFVFFRGVYDVYFLFRDGGDARGVE